MKQNISTKDANIRTLVAGVLIVVVFFFVENPYARIVAALISAILAGTAFFRICPIYYITHKDTVTQNSDNEPVSIDTETAGQTLRDEKSQEPIA